MAIAALAAQGFPVPPAFETKVNRKKFNETCAALKSTTHVVQWGNADVWKIGDKIFAVGSRWGKDNNEIDVKISFKCSQISYDMLIEQNGIIPAPYLARAKWVQLETTDALSDEDVILYLRNAYEIISGKLTKAKRAELGISSPN